jgi:hypothetical protein
MEQLHHRSRWPVAILILSLLLLLVVLLMAAGKQVTLPMTGIQSNWQVMPPDPEDWCRKVKANKLDAEIARAELFFSDGVGESLVDWRYLRRALKHTGVQVNGPEDTYWLETIKRLYSGCSP